MEIRDYRTVAPVNPIQQSKNNTRKQEEKQENSSNDTRNNDFYNILQKEIDRKK